MIIDCECCIYHDEKDNTCLAYNDLKQLPCEEGTVTVGYIRFEWKDEKDSND